MNLTPLLPAADCVLDAKDIIHFAVSIGSALFMAGAAWAGVRASVRGLSDKLDQHIQQTLVWRAEIGTQVNNLTNNMLSK